MKKKGGILGLLVISILLISILSSVSLVSASWFDNVLGKITGKVTENETNEEVTDGEREEEVSPEPEPCPTIIGWRIEDNKCISDSGCDYDSSKYTYYDREEKCVSQLEPPPEPPPVDRQCKEGEEKYYKCSDGTEVSECKCENGMWVCKISPENDCPDEEVGICAAKIKINFDKTSYVVGEQFEIKIGVFDSQENPLSNYAFYAEMYDDRWHTPDLQRTDSDGYFRHTGIAEKPAGGITKVKFKVYTKEIGSCGVVEDATQLEIRQAPVPCGIGGCVPESECKDKIRECGGDCPACPEEKNKTDIFYPCSGCEADGKCYPLGYRKEAMYCSDNYEFVNQMEEGKCDNSFECKSNVCVSGECIGEGLIKKIIAWFNKLFGGGDEEDEDDKICRRLLIEKNIGDYEYFTTEYGKRKEQQVGLFSEDGEQIGIVKCCVAGYKFPDGTEGIAGIVCPFDNREDVENSLQGLVNKGELVLGEYKGQELYRRFDKPEEVPEVIAWTNNAYLIASGRGPGEGQISEEIADAYLDKYTNDLETIEIPKVTRTQIQGGPEKFLEEIEKLGEVTLVDFETLPDGTVLQNGDRLTGKEWESLGVVFEFPSEDYLQAFGPMYPFNPLDKLSLSPGLGPFEAGGDTHDDLNIIFSEPVKAVGIYLLDLGPDISETESISFLDINGDVINKISPWPGPSFGNPAPGTFVSLIHEGISRIEILEDTQDGDDIAYDNLYFVR